eukprot:Skav211652  [mRNA]  locus=scaffold1290:312904:315642:- [translate_table: standard]
MRTHPRKTWPRLDGCELQGESSEMILQSLLSTTSPRLHCAQYAIALCQCVLEWLLTFIFRDKGSLRHTVDIYLPSSTAKARRVGKESEAPTPDPREFEPVEAVEGVMATGNGQGVMTAQQLIDTVQRLEQQMTLSNQREQALQQRLDEVTTQLAASQQQLLDAVKQKGERKVTLVDDKGLARPDRFTGSEEHFLYWKTRMEAFITSVFPEMDDVLEWAEERDTEVDDPALAAAFGDVNPSHKAVPDLGSINQQLYAILQTLCEKESFTIVRSAGKGNGLEAWRKLVKRFDPSTGGRRRAMLRSILNPSKCGRVEDLWSAIESWEESVRLYEQRKRPDGSRHVLDEEVKIATLEFLCPAEIERHLQLNRSR